MAVIRSVRADRVARDITSGYQRPSPGRYAGCCKRTNQAPNALLRRGGYS